MISILLPSRRRPKEFSRMVHSARDTAVNEIEVVVYRDNDDETEYEVFPFVKEVRGERIVLSEMWNVCSRYATGDILMHAGDDIIFRTPGWDTLVEEVFQKFPDKVLFVHGDDGFWGKRFGTHGFIHRTWMETIGYFVPPYYSSDYNDTHLNDVANALGRRRYVPMLTEHMHPAFGKATLDITHQERLARHEKDNVDALYKSLKYTRREDIKKLKKIQNEDWNDWLWKIGLNGRLIYREQSSRS